MYRIALSTVVVAIAVGATVLILVGEIPYREVGEYGYLAVFIITLIGTAAIIAPVPYIAAIIVGGSFLSPLGVAAVAGVAAALGELVGYTAGYAGRAFVPTAAWARALERAMQRYGGPVIFLASVLPNPVFDVVGVFAGAGRTPLWVFMGGCFLGKGLRFLALAALGEPLTQWLGPLLNLP